MLLDQGREAAQQSGAVRRRNRAPRRERGSCSSHRAIGLTGAGLLEFCHGLFRGGVQEPKGHPRSKKRSRS